MEVYEVLKEQKINISICRDANRVFIIGGWSTGMIGVSKTFGRGSIPLPPVKKQLHAKHVAVFLHILKFK